ncbi:unnamed protein product, partial [Rotaria magnacalcarata]
MTEQLPIKFQEHLQLQNVGINVTLTINMGPYFGLYRNGKLDR